MLITFVLGIPQSICCSDRSPVPPKLHDCRSSGGTNKKASKPAVNFYLTYIFRSLSPNITCFFFKPDIAFIYLQKDDCFANTYCNKNGADAFNSLLYKLQMSHI